MRDPILHSFGSDCLPKEHPLANKGISCKNCHQLIHASNNECMSTWIESGLGNFCLSCYANLENKIIEHGTSKELDNLNLPDL